MVHVDRTQYQPNTTRHSKRRTGGKKCPRWISCITLTLAQFKPLLWRVAGLELAVFRDTSGTAHVVDAYCPHMGASLSVGGQVKGNCIECPFHGWRFRGDDGKCVHVPYTDAKYSTWILSVAYHMSPLFEKIVLTVKNSENSGYLQLESGSTGKCSDFRW